MCAAPRLCSAHAQKPRCVQNKGVAQHTARGQECETFIKIVVGTQDLVTRASCRLSCEMHACTPQRSTFCAVVRIFVLLCVCKHAFAQESMHAVRANKNYIPTMILTNVSHFRPRTGVLRHNTAWRSAVPHHCAEMLRHGGAAHLSGAKTKVRNIRQDHGRHAIFVHTHKSLPLPLSLALLIFL